MKGKMDLLLLVFVFYTSSPGVCPLRSQELHVKAGEMAILHCPHYRGYSDREADVFWTSHTVHKTNFFNNMSTSAERRQMGVQVHGRILVILRASVNHQGNYSCSFRNSSRRSWISLKVYTAQSREYDEITQYKKTCYTEEPCTLYCPDEHIPVETLNISSNSLTWHKEGESSPSNDYFSSVKKEDSGIYTCTRSYLYDGQLYNMTSTMNLDVQPSEKSNTSVIISPKDNQIFDVDLDSTVVIDCKAVMYSEFEHLFWLSGTSFVEVNSSLPVFYNYTRSASVSDHKTKEIKGTASLVFRRVSEDDLSKRFICKLQSDYETSFVTITLKQKAPPSSLSVALWIVAFVLVVMMVLTVVIYAKFKMDITLFLRDNLGCCRSTPDGKSYDTCLMYYKSTTDAGLNEDDRKTLESEMKERFGYSLCLYSPDIVAEEEAVLDCLKQSHTLVLVPSSEDSGPGSGLLNVIQAPLKELHTHVVFIQTETAGGLNTSSSPEALQLCKAADCVTWKGKSSLLPSSSFWKQLRYYLPAQQGAPRLLPEVSSIRIHHQ
ncbi:interleukin-1 receptor accessory protein-like isoform X2 [Archocentrus centrarchus]|uniref:interleukin-1 receptor accessory protein-like isoform X2 n=1 Tax=Archocentrus centrarchus TaxID=63155 RepID=UPI0011EA02E8|nr:interleukin-1 receptor accessory protein-like isoform X2 [Archocentrus centrarchus]